MVVCDCCTVPECTVILSIADEFGVDIGVGIVVAAYKFRSKVCRNAIDSQVSSSHCCCWPVPRSRMGKYDK